MLQSCEGCALRQGSNRLYGSGISSGAASLRRSIYRNVVYAIFEPCLSKLALTPVSYTHLDVYKRQAYSSYSLEVFAEVPTQIVEELLRNERSGLTLKNIALLSNNESEPQWYIQGSFTNDAECAVYSPTVRVTLYDSEGQVLQFFDFEINQQHEDGSSSSILDPGAHFTFTSPTISEKQHISSVFVGVDGVCIQ